MRAVRALPPRIMKSRSRVRTGWLVAAGMAAAAAVVWGVGLGKMTPASFTTPPGVATQASFVGFALHAPQARSVVVVGDFNDWDPRATPLQPGSGASWATQVALAPGRYRYAFLVDGKQWMHDPTAPLSEEDFGSRNSILTVGT